MDKIKIKITLGIILMCSILTLGFNIGIENIPLNCNIPEIFILTFVSIFGLISGSISLSILHKIIEVIK